MIKKEYCNSFDEITNTRNNVIRYIYAYKFNGTLEELKIEEGKGGGFKKFSLYELENLHKEEKNEFIPKLISNEYLELYKEIMI